MKDKKFIICTDQELAEKLATIYDLAKKETQGDETLFYFYNEPMVAKFDESILDEEKVLFTNSMIV